jgi:hypothetical protein
VPNEDDAGSPTIDHAGRVGALEALMEDVRNHRGAPRAAVAAARALAGPDVLKHLNDGEKEKIGATLADFALGCAQPLQEDAVLALDAVAPWHVLSVCKTLFRKGTDQLRDGVHVHPPAHLAQVEPDPGRAVIASGTSRK